MRPATGQRIGGLLGCAWAWGLIAWGIFACPNNARAQVNTDAFATRGYRGADVLRVETELQLPPSRSFGVARVTIKNPKRASQADRKLRVVLFTHSVGSGMEGFAYSKDVVLAEGQSQVSVDLPYVESGSQTAWDVAVLEDGRDLEDKRQRPPNTLSWNWTNSVGANARNSIAVIYGSQESPQQVAKLLSGLPDVRTNSVTFNNAQPGVAVVAPLDMPHFVSLQDAADDWRYYYPYSLWVLSSATLVECQSQFPEVASALRSFVATGGTLLVHDLAAADLPKVERLLGYSDPAPEWFAASSVNGWLATENDAKAALDASQLQERWEQSRFVGCRYLSGTVLVLGTPLADLAADERNAVFQANHSRVLNTLGMESDGNWFWMNLIEAAGKPPVWTFAILVALFGALLGPGLLFLTARIGRRSLMIFLVPCISLLATAAIVCYGVLHEGFRTHIRVTSLTRVDADAGTGFAWSRQNYFSGLPPKAGIAFQADTYVRPVYGEQSNVYRYSDPRSGLSSRVFLGELQQWTGWLKPRQQQQLLVGHPIADPELPIRVESSSEGRLRVTNVSGSLVQLLLLRGAEDDYYFIEQLSAGASVELESLKLEEAKAAVQRGMVDLTPRAPADMYAGGSLFNFGRRRNTSSARTRATDMIQDAIDRYLSDSKLALPRFTFAAVLSENERIEVPLEGEREGDLHIFVGEMRW